MRFLLVVLLVLQRVYWPTPIDTLYVGHQKHTHASVVGLVRYCRTESDGDRHFKLTNPPPSTDTIRFVIAEIIPLIPMPCPVAGRVVRVNGITRLDTEHGWREIHPVESWTYVP